MEHQTILDNERYGPMYGTLYEYGTLLKHVPGRQIVQVYAYSKYLQVLKSRYGLSAIHTLRAYQRHCKSNLTRPSLRCVPVISSRSIFTSQQPNIFGCHLVLKKKGTKSPDLTVPVLIIYGCGCSISTKFWIRIKRFRMPQFQGKNFISYMMFYTNAIKC